MSQDHHGPPEADHHKKEKDTGVSSVPADETAGNNVEMSSLARLSFFTLLAIAAYAYISRPGLWIPLAAFAVVGATIIFSSSRGIFFVKMKTGEIIAPEANGIEKFVMTPDTAASLRQSFRHTKVVIDRIADLGGRQVCTSLLERLKDEIKKSEIPIVRSRGPLTWMGYHFMGFNPFRRPAQADKGKGKTHVPVVFSETFTVKGVEVSGKGGAGMMKVTVKVEFPRAFYVWFYNIFAVERSTREEIRTRIEAAVTLLLGGVSFEDLEVREFPDRNRWLCLATLLAHGMVTPEISVVSIEIENPESVKALEKLALQGALNDQLVRDAEARATITVTEATAEAKKIEKVARASAEALQMKLGALLDNGTPLLSCLDDVDVLRALFGNGYGTVPVGVTYLAGNADGSVAGTESAMLAASVAAKPEKPPKTSESVPKIPDPPPSKPGK